MFGAISLYESASTAVTQGQSCQGMIWAKFHSLLLSLLFHFCYPLDSLSPIDGAKLSGLTFEAAIGNEHSISRLGSVTPANLRNILYGAEVGNKESLYFFGLLKLYGISVPRDEQVASDSFRKAGDLGHPEAATALGTMLSNGIGGRKDYSAAVTAFRTGIQLGDKNALWLLGK